VIENEFEFDPHKACEALQEEIDWQLQEWKNEMWEEMTE